MRSVLLDYVPLWGIRDPFSMLSHLFGALLSLFGLHVLVLRARRAGLRGWAVGRLAAYGVSMVLVFTASSLFHYTLEEVVFLKKMDHAAIFLVMGGTCTAIYGALDLRRSTWLITGIWLLALGSIAVKWIVWPMPLWLTAACYVGVGSLASSGLMSVVRKLERDGLHLLLGGLALLIAGTIFFATEQPKLWPGVIEGHEIFHVIVLIATGMHFLFIWRHCAGCEAEQEAHTQNREALGSVRVWT